MAGVTACLPRRHLGSVIVTTMDTASPCSPLKLIQADQQPALSASMGTADLFMATGPVTCPNKAWVSSHINKCHSAWSALLITADLGLNRWNNHTKVTFTKHWLVHISHLVTNIRTSIFSIYYPGTLKHGPLRGWPHQHTFTLFCVGFALLLQKDK